MFKLNFYIRLKNDYKKVRGWIETFQAPDGSIIQIGIDKRLNLWHLTEINSGYSITPLGFKTRKEAIVYISKSEFLQKIANRLKEPDLVIAADSLADYIRTQVTKGLSK